MSKISTSWAIPQSSRGLFCPQCNSILKMSDDTGGVSCWECDYQIKGMFLIHYVYISNYHTNKYISHKKNNQYLVEPGQEQERIQEKHYKQETGMFSAIKIIIITSTFHKYF